MGVRFAAVLLAFAVVVSTAAAQKKSSGLQSRLESEFLGKPFPTKVRLGAYLRYYHSGLGGDCTRLIDTEVSPDGSVAYQARRGCLEGDFLAANFYVRPDAMTGTHPIGTQVWIWKIELKDDRVEFWLQSTPNSNLVKDYAKLKFMLGKGYQRWDYDTILDQIARALKVESYERALALKAEFAELSAQLAEAERNYQAQSASASARLASATRLANLLGRLAQNRSAYTALGRDDAKPEEYLRRVRELESEIQGLEPIVRKEKAEGMRQSLQRETAQANQLKAGLQAPAPTTLSEWESRLETLNRYNQVLLQQRALLMALKDLGEPIAPAEWTELEENLRWSEDIGNRLMRVRTSLELEELNRDFRAMERERLRLLDAYTRAFNTRQEQPALEALLVHLRRMLDNRLAAERLGSEKASGQAAQLRKEIEKLSKR
jgi:hypothetical protein